MDHYSKARREGLKEYTAAIQSNADPYLPVLEDKVANLSQLSRQSLGVISIPVDRIIGSVSSGRSYAFAGNFMPILEGASEFATKWERLYESVEQEGLNMPVIALEYMGEYYIIEGNKRTSVMKSMGALELEGDVTRVIPERDGSPEVEAAFEYFAFTKATGMYALYFSRPGSYQKLVSLPGMRAGQEWTEEHQAILEKMGIRNRPEAGMGNSENE